MSEPVTTGMVGGGRVGRTITDPPIEMSAQALQCPICTLICYQHHLLPEMLLRPKPKSSNSVRSNSPTVSYRSEAAIFCRLLLCLGCFYGYLGLCFLPLWPTHSGALYGTIVAMWDLQATKLVNCKKETNAKWSYDGAYPRSKAILYHSFGSVTMVILQWMQLKVITTCFILWWRMICSKSDPQCRSIGGCTGHTASPKAGEVWPQRVSPDNLT